MYKVKRFSKIDKKLAAELLQNAKRQAKENPLTATSLSLVGVNSGMNIYNSISSKKSRDKMRKTVESLSPKKKSNIIIV